MKNCANCGAELEPGMKFCNQCGKPVPQTKVCPKCGTEQKPEAKFCSNCGHRFGAPAADGGAADMGLKIGHSTVMGDIRNTVNHVTNVTNADETRHVVKCHVCGKVLTVVGTHECPKCHGNVCDEHFDLARKMCTACVERVQKEGEAAFRQAIREELKAGGGRITQEAFGRLRQKRTALGLDEARGRELIAAERRAEAPADGTALTDVQRRFLERAKRLIFNDGKCAEGVAEIDRLLGSGVALGDEILAVLMPALLVCDEKRGDQIAERTLVDSLPVALYRVDQALRGGDFPVAERAIVQAERIWPDDIQLVCRRVALYCCMYWTLDNEQDKAVFYEKARELLGDLKTSDDMLANSWLSYATNMIEFSGEGGNFRVEDRDSYEMVFNGYLMEPEYGPMRVGLPLKRYERGLFLLCDGNYEEAVRFFRMSAEAGVDGAQWELGQCYELGRGVGQSFEEAAKWFAKAAEHGHKEAQARLAEIDATRVRRFNIGSNKKTVKYMLTAFRDGFTCAMGARAQHKHFRSAIAAAYDAGVRWLEIGGGAAFNASYAYCQENAFDVMDSFRKICPDAELQTLSRGPNIVGLDSQPAAVIRLYAKLFRKHGVNAIRDYDALYDPDNLKLPGQCIHEAGMLHEVAIGTMGVPSWWNLGYAHTPEFYAERIRVFLEAGVQMDRLCFKDNSGTTQPTVIYDAVRLARRLLGDAVHIQFHTHDSVGLGRESCLAALKGGADGIDLSFAPLSGGAFQPDILDMYQALQGSEDFEFDFDVSKMKGAVREFQEAVKKYYLMPEALSENRQLVDLPVPNGTLTAVLMMLRKEQVDQPCEKLVPELAECVRRGGAAATTLVPTAQFYLDQAMMNVLFGRFKCFHPGFAKLLLGYFGQLPVKPDASLVESAISFLAAKPETQAYACRTTRPIIELNNADPSKGIGPACRRLSENGIPAIEENILISATCKDRGVQFLVGNGQLGCRFADYAQRGEAS